MSDRDKHIQNEAYRLWEEAGRPDTGDQAFWFEAEKRIAAGETKSAPPKTSKGKASGETATAARSPGSRGAEAHAVAAPSKGAAVEVGLTKKRSPANANAKKPEIEKLKKSTAPKSNAPRPKPKG